MILICFHRQAAQTDNLVWNSRPTWLWDLQSHLVNIPERNQGWQPVFVCVPHVLTGKTSEPNTGISYLYPVISFRGISLEPHIALSLQLKKQQRGVTSESANRSVDTAEAHQSWRLCSTLTVLSQSAELSAKDTPKPLWKLWGGDELWHHRGTLIIMTRRGRRSSLSGGALHHKRGMRSAKVVCSRAEKLTGPGFTWIANTSNV